MNRYAARFRYRFNEISEMKAICSRICIQKHLRLKNIHIRYAIAKCKLINENSFAVIRRELLINGFPLRKPAHYLMDNRTDASQLYRNVGKQHEIWRCV